VSSRLLAVVGARPNIVKAAAVLHALREVAHMDADVVHTGQHCDRSMSDSILEDSRWAISTSSASRSTTERPVTLTDGTNRLVPLDPSKLAHAAQEELCGSGATTGRAIDLWDGAAGPRSARVIADFLTRNEE
jgi:UDP-N-acetylglucosamine 2-epimerase